MKIDPKVVRAIVRSPQDVVEWWIAEYEAATGRDATPEDYDAAWEYVQADLQRLRS